MTSKVKRLGALAALGTTIGIVAPAASADAAPAPLPGAGLALPGFAGTGLPNFAGTGLPNFAGTGLPNFPATGLPAFNPSGLAFTGPSIGQVAAVIGPTVITTAPSTFTNTNIQVSAGSNGSGGQAGP